MCRSQSCLLSIATIAASSLLASCSAEKHEQNAILGYWINDAGEADALEFFPDGSLSITGLRKSDRIRGSYRFLDDDNIEMNLRFEARNEWRPTWMPPGVRRDPVLRARLSFSGDTSGDTLEFRPRGQIKADRIEQFIEFGLLRFRRAEPPEEDPNATDGAATAR
jgi:hypothetical protein